MKSISDFAEDLILAEVQGITEGKLAPPSMATNTPAAAPAGKDIREIKVPESFMHEVLGEDFIPSAQEEELVNVEELPEEVPEEPNSLMISEGKVDELLVLLQEVKELLSEMTMGTTSTGQIGVNLGGPGKGSKLKPQKGYATSIKSTLPGNFRSARDVFRHSMKRKKRC